MVEGIGDGMIPILYESTETAFASNGLGRLRDCISCIVTEERNGLYECDFEYPVGGAHYDEITIGRIIGVTHDESGDIQPFDIVSYSKPIDKKVTFHAVHISYRQSYLTVRGTNINSLSDAFTLLGNATPNNPFTYITDKESTGYASCFDGVPKTVRQTLGGVEGSVLDTYGGEYEWNKWNVILWASRGRMRDFTIRYGVNMLDYNEEQDSSGCYSSCIPYWTDGTTTIVGDKQNADSTSPSGRDQCIPLDVSDKFESQPTKAQVEAMGLAVMNSENSTIPTQNITVSFVRIQDTEELARYQNLLQCNLCDTINVVFPEYKSVGTFKIVKTVWNVLNDKYDEMELGDLSTTLSQALGISQGTSSATAKTVIQAGGSSNISLSSGTMTNVPLSENNVLFNSTNDVVLDTSLHALKIKTAGLYIVQGSVYIGSTTSSASSVGCFVRRGANGAAFSSATEIMGAVSARAGTTDYTAHTPIKMFQLAVDDVIYLAGRVQGSTGTLSGANSSTFLFIEKL